MPTNTGKPKFERLTCSIEETRALLGVSRTTVYALINDGALRAIKLRNRTMIPRAEIDRLAAGGDDARPAA